MSSKPENTNQKTPDYIKFSTENLLEQFGAGSHKPGAGTAASLLGLQSANLLLTVIDRTLNDKNHNDVHHTIKEFDQEIREKSIPELKRLFQLDSEKFHDHFMLRMNARKEVDSVKKAELKKIALKKLKLPTEIPLEIADICQRLSEIARFMFDNGVKHVRGDTGVAFSAATGGIAGSVAIVELNLTYFPDSAWSKKVRNRSLKYKESFELQSEVIADRLGHMTIQADKQMKVNTFNSDVPHNEYLTFAEIEELARELQLTLWNYKLDYNNKIDDSNPISILDPSIALDFLGYKVERLDFLGQIEKRGKNIEVAGTINKPKKLVGISTQQKSSIQRFTAAHELGHAILHNLTVLHRDGPIEGLDEKESKWLEKQANKFAAYFLMPRVQIEKAFFDRYYTQQFVQGEDTLFRLGLKNLKGKFKSERELSLYLVQNSIYQDFSFESMHELFGVSPIAMAIRLEELNLVKI